MLTGLSCSSDCWARWHQQLFANNSCSDHQLEPDLTKFSCHQNYSQHELYILTHWGREEAWIACLSLALVSTACTDTCSHWDLKGFYSSFSSDASKHSSAEAMCYSMSPAKSNSQSKAVNFIVKAQIGAFTIAQRLAVRVCKAHLTIEASCLNDQSVSWC